MTDVVDLSIGNGALVVPHFMVELKESEGTFNKTCWMLAENAHLETSNSLHTHVHKHNSKWAHRAHYNHLVRVTSLGLRSTVDINSELPSLEVVKFNGLATTHLKLLSAFNQSAAFNAMTWPAVSTFFSENQTPLAQYYET